MSKLSDEQMDRFREDGGAFVAYVDAMIRACAPPDAEVSKKDFDWLMQSNSHRWVVRLGSSDEILVFDYRVVAMVERHDAEGFGSCSKEGECEAVCPKEISISNIARMHRDYFRAALVRGTKG